MQAEKIISIKRVGEVRTVDIEVNNKSHLFFANGICTSNSHATAYSIISYWDAWLSHYYPAEFFASNLSYTEDKDKKKELLEYVTGIGIKIKLPKVGKSHPTKWKTCAEWLLMPFTEIDGIGEKQANVIVSENSKKRTGFFESSAQTSLPQKTKQILADIRAYDFDHDPTYNEAKKIRQFFSYNLLNILDL